MARVTVEPAMLAWAIERSGKSAADLLERFPKLVAWLGGDAMPTLRQLESFAHATYVPIGYLFLPTPIEEHLPIPDFRTIGGKAVGRPSADLLDTLYLCQQRQEWYREYARNVGAAPSGLVGAAKPHHAAPHAAAALRERLGLAIESRRSLSSWQEALRQFIVRVEESGVLVMVSGVVGNNPHRKLDPQEFRGFALADELAPLIFVNGADTKAAQMFTLAHELAHVCLGQSALSDAEAREMAGAQLERWCNEVAAELLAPLAFIQREFRAEAPLDAEMHRLSRRLKVSTLVVLRRMYDAGKLPSDDYHAAYSKELARLLAVRRTKGGSFYPTQGARLSRRFARAIIVSTLEGRNSFTEAFRLLGVRRLETFRELGNSLGIPA